VAHCGELLLDARRGQLAAELLDSGCGMERLHSDEIHHPLGRAPGKEVAGGAGVGPPGVGIADRDREELKEPPPCIRAELFWVEVQGGVMDYAPNLALDSQKTFGKSAPTHRRTLARPLRRIYPRPNRAAPVQTVSQITHPPAKGCRYRR
jgi:hypothetical protein